MLGGIFLVFHWVFGGLFWPWDLYGKLAQKPPKPKKKPTKTILVVGSIFSQIPFFQNFWGFNALNPQGGVALPPWGQRWLGFSNSLGFFAPAFGFQVDLGGGGVLKGGKGADIFPGFCKSGGTRIWFFWMFFLFLWWVWAMGQGSFGKVCSLTGPFMSKFGFFFFLTNQRGSLGMS